MPPQGRHCIGFGGRSYPHLLPERRHPVPDLSEAYDERSYHDSRRDRHGDAFDIALRQPGQVKPEPALPANSEIPAVVVRVRLTLFVFVFSSLQSMNSTLRGLMLQSLPTAALADSSAILLISSA